MKTRIFTITLLIALLLAACSSGSELANTGNQPSVTTQATQERLTQPTDQSPDTQQVPVEPAQVTTTAESIAPTQSAQAVSCTLPAAITPSLAEGPYWKQGSPERTNLIDTGITGTKLTLTGYVLDTDCQPIANAWIDFWQTDAQGQYDNSGYTLRGHQYTDASGRYTLETIIPGLYPGRTEHIHVKLQAPDGPVLTTQLFFPEAQQNDSDRIFTDALVLPLQEQDGETFAQFNFIVPTE